MIIFVTVSGARTQLPRCYSLIVYGQHELGVLNRMFQNLKARRGVSGNSEYVVQSASPPFERNRAKKQQACTFCKLKKLKCTPQESSCARCLKQGLQCSYSTVDTTEMTIDYTDPTDTSAIDRRQSDPTSDSGNEVDLPANSSLSDPIHDDHDSSLHFFFPNVDFSGLMNNADGLGTCTGISDPEVDFWHRDPTAFPPNQISDFTADFISDCALEGDKNNPGGEPINGSKTWPQPASTMAGDTDCIHVQVPRASSTTPTPAPTSATRAKSLSGVSGTGCSGPEMSSTQPAQSLSSTCRCLDHVLCANKAMQVKLVWGASLRSGTSVSVDDMLQCQKDVLGSCETLLKCNSCRLRAEYLMLVVSMCHEMTNVLGDFYTMTVPRSQCESSKRPRRGSDKLTSATRGVLAGGWQLEDEDEVQIIRRLIGVRITKLGNLISQLETAVSSNHSTYEWIIRALRELNTDKIVSIRSEGDSIPSNVDS
ncbi:hypothetical protein BKA67DRAFT_542041 [Truncatella angustata]|uniref:Zn(2)-C6 fungal-type domain-containing protein n=1 Tax=Truncatella angustata TaxID=152316 RepID=A0A9P8RKM5_9PEZI|nr:uncharacterized protein BKA67DRAFT_542041 [Truncatella angustata]KAH6645055.1 hypothetical protein BKA67DRAFT_542041 [Truncatella angustata]